MSTISLAIAEDPGVGHNTRTPRSQALAAYLAEGGTASVVKLDREAHRQRLTHLFTPTPPPPPGPRRRVEP